MYIQNIIQSRISNILFFAVRQARPRLTSSLLTVSIVLAGLGMYAAGVTAAVVDNPVKWHPGHYVMLVEPGMDNPDYMEKVYRELASTPALRGVVIRFSWAELEPSKGAYNFKSIDKHLAELTERKKRLIILLETKSFDPDKIHAPKYLRTSEYEGGIFATGPGSRTEGYNIKLWNDRVRDRLSALVTALGNRYNGKPYFEGFGLQETAMGNPIKPLTANQIDAFYDNLLAVNRQMRNSFRNTLTYQYTNYPRGILSSFIGTLKGMGAALGGPDIFIQDPGLLFKGTQHSEPGLYTYYPKLSGTMPLVIQVEKSNYEDTRHDGSGYKPTVNELLTFGRDKLKVNYIFWTRSPGYYDKVLEMLRMQAQKSTPSGGLNSACPSVFASCTK